MPVTFSPAGNPIPAKSAEVKGVTASQILKYALNAEQYSSQVDSIRQCLIGGRAGRQPQHKIAPNRNGFVDTVLAAYNEQHALIVRPDDVWLSIVSQFSFFLNAKENAQLLRANFADVAPGELEIHGEVADLRGLSKQMGDLLQKNALDPDLRSWIVPDFSTTTQCDLTVGSLLMLTTMKKASDASRTSRSSAGECGISRVTLEGEKKDWEDVLTRLEKLRGFGLKAIAWSHILHPVISQFIDAFDDPSSPDNLTFWNTVVSPKPLASGNSTLSGWICAFCVFSEDGEWRGAQTPKATAAQPETLGAKRFWTTYNKQFAKNGPEYPPIDATDVPPSYGVVEVLLSATPNDEHKTRSTIVAGLVGLGISSSRDTALSESGRNDSVRPVVAWWIYQRAGDRKTERKPKKAVVVVAPPQDPVVQEPVVPRAITPPVETQPEPAPVHNGDAFGFASETPTPAIETPVTPPVVKPEPESVVKGKKGKKAKKEVVVLAPDPEPVAEEPVAPVVPAAPTSPVEEHRDPHVDGDAFGSAFETPAHTVETPVIPLAPEPQPEPEPEPEPEPAAKVKPKGKKDKKGKKEVPVAEPVVARTPSPSPVAEQSAPVTASFGFAFGGLASTAEKPVIPPEPAAKEEQHSPWGMPASHSFVIPSISASTPASGLFDDDWVNTAQGAVETHTETQEQQSQFEEVSFSVQDQAWHTTGDRNEQSDFFHSDSHSQPQLDSFGTITPVPVPAPVVADAWAETTGAGAGEEVTPANKTEPEPEIDAAAGDAGATSVGDAWGGEAQPDVVAETKLEVEAGAAAQPVEAGAAAQPVEAGAESNAQADGEPTPGEEEATPAAAAAVEETEDFGAGVKFVTKKKGGGKKKKGK
ncbi:hypothetical protein C8F01DRAFT_1367552 [Mycena amicta]|nr:hypothetical protein C8F01DRAFT_1367552 [Mycena amicta]